jgi:hypothetical protein
MGSTICRLLHRLTVFRLRLQLTFPQVASFDALKPLTSLSNLTCLYLEHNPLAKDFEYRMTVTKMLPSLQQLDATMVNRTVS